MSPRRPSLARLYTELNAQLWDGRLPAPTKVGLYGRTKDRVWVQRIAARASWTGIRYEYRSLRCRVKGGIVRAWGTFRQPGEFRPATINVISPLDPAAERRILLHEMCHAAVFFLAGGESISHGPRFVAELRRLATLGEVWPIDAADRYERDFATDFATSPGKREHGTARSGTEETKAGGPATAPEPPVITTERLDLRWG